MEATDTDNVRSPEQRDAGPPAALVVSAQARLEVGPADSPLEREAEQLADIVVREVAAGAVAARSRGVSRGDSGKLQRSCAKSTAHASESTEDELVQRRADSTATPVAKVDASSFAQVRGERGHPLPLHVQKTMTQALGYDFSHIHVHTSRRASELARSVRAEAFTVGRDIVFAPGRFQPLTSAGMRLLAHELVHTAQQGAVPRTDAATPVKTAPGGEALPLLEAGAGAADTCEDIEPESFEKAKRRKGILRLWLKKVARKELKPCELRARWACWSLALIHAGELELSPEEPQIRGRLERLAAWTPTDGAAEEPTESREIGEENDEVTAPPPGTCRPSNVDSSCSCADWEAIVASIDAAEKAVKPTLAMLEKPLTGANKDAFTTMFGADTPEQIDRVKNVLTETLGEIGLMKGRSISCPPVTTEGVIASRHPNTGALKFYPPFFRYECSVRTVGNCATIDTGPRATLFRRITAIHEASHVKIMAPEETGGPTRRAHPHYADTGILRVLPFIAPDKGKIQPRNDAIENPDSIAIFATATGGAEKKGLVGVLTAAGDAFDDRAEGVPEAERGPLVAVVRLARWIAVSGLEMLKSVTLENEGPFQGEGENVKDAIVKQCTQALQVFGNAFIVGGSGGDARPGALAVARPAKLKGLPSSMTPQVLTDSARVMIQAILTAHGQVFVSKALTVLSSPKKPSANDQDLAMFVKIVASHATNSIL